MEFTKSEIIFNDEERWIAGLPESMPIGEGCEAIKQVNNARTHCARAFGHLLLCDVELLTDEEVLSLRAYPPRIRKLDSMADALQQVA